MTITTSTGHVITVSQVETWFEVSVNESPIAVFSPGFGPAEVSRLAAERLAQSLARQYEVDAKWVR